MKQSSTAFAILLLLASATACTGADLSTAQMNSAVQTLTATVQPPTVTATPDPDESAIVLLLNHGFEQISDPLAQTLDARYQVLDVSFPLDGNNKASTFLVQVRCECVNGGCCTAERTFVMLVHAMKSVADKVARQVPGTVTNLQVASLDHAASMGIVLVSWQDMADYFTGTINGFQLGGRVIKLGP